MSKQDSPKLEAWQCANCQGIEVQVDKPWTNPGPENRFSRCYDSGHDWKPIWLAFAGPRDHQPDDGEMIRAHYESLGI